MSRETCQREGEILDALGRGFVGAELEAHAAACPSCGELRLVAGALLGERARAVAEARVPAAGTMWWRLQVRHRREAAATARRSLLIGQALTLALALALVVAFFGGALAYTVRDWAEAIRPNTPLLFALAVWILAVPIAGWVALRQK